ncbi:helix-turn-helix domain-containing protein [Paenibacillus sp. BC26]|uniref:helix-turn-helix domain-containing protein n=1 Tax=Paenibacillus sp. BC26 TaxID=1881032 RepID=UPI0015A50041|nr:AraC family transcriptional regulator [Paenibacillus sp. BC26]
MRDQLQTTIETLADKYSVGLEGELVLPAKELMKLESLDLLFEDVYRVFMHIHHHLQESRNNRKNYSVLREVKEYIDANYQNPDLSLEYLSDKFELGNKNLSKLFKEEFGENFIDYLTRLRINLAKQMLCATKLPIQDIAAAVAYSSSIAFGRVFKRIVGITPTAYREMGEAMESSSE